MLLEIKLYGGLICNNQDLESFRNKKFVLEIQESYTLGKIHKLLSLSTAGNLVSLVNGHAQQPGYVIDKDCSISIFPPMADRRHNFFDKL